ncbi:MAG: ACP S-malonyltransferase [Gammaproteobacteria bacterium]|nr:ACP S-malonyltransferase [Gammaproteobacteria bacterium]MCF6229786.1 ACP S-malonyltransferase [Gammaproteobacteria bacterium]
MMSLAFVFPGQGSQSIGMLSDLAALHPVVNETFNQASAVLGYDVWQVVQEGPLEKLNQTATTQPAMLAAGVATWRVWQSQSEQLPVVMAGHSLGEYSALVCAGVIDFEEAIQLVAERGRLMQQAVPAGEGAMAAILGLADEAVIAVCEQAADNEVVSSVNFNSPGQVVIAGQKNAVERAIELAKQAGAKRALLLPVSVPSHCSLMEPAAEQLRLRMADMVFSAPTLPVINNVDVKAENDPQAIRDALARQLYRPVRWVESVNVMADQGVDRLVECGPGKVLAGLTKRINKTISAQAVFDQVSLQKALAE